VAQLLVSVRSGPEARRALEGGASIIDIKEPSNGPLGKATADVWQEVCDEVGTEAPISVALGEITEWNGFSSLNLRREFESRVFYRKLGLAGAPADWRTICSGLWRSTAAEFEPGWIAVVYADWRNARAPDPDSVLKTALGSAMVAGVLVDTWSKGQHAVLGPEWINLARRIRAAGKLLALAGGLTLESIPSLARFAPHIVAVRGAACSGGDRRASIDRGRVAELAGAVAALPEPRTPTRPQT
jgi:(5-formylfuran-3-yl)methyl phosphate synthase